MPESLFDILALVKGDLPVRDDMLLERMGHEGFPGRHTKKICSAATRAT